VALASEFLQQHGLTPRRLPQSRCGNVVGFTKPADDHARWPKTPWRRLLRNHERAGPFKTHGQAPANRLLPSVANHKTS
jgi:hypothetical protein